MTHPHTCACAPTRPRAPSAIPSFHPSLLLLLLFMIMVRYVQSASLSDLAIRYSDASVLEQHHAATMFALLRPREARRVTLLPGAAGGGGGGRRRSFLSRIEDAAPAAGGASGASGAAAAVGVEVDVISVLGLQRGDFMAFRKLAIAGILATDMTHHNALTEQARRLTPEGARDMTAKTLTELLVHSADISNPVLPAFESVHAWAALVCAEFSAQVALEKAAGLPFAPHMDGLTTDAAIAKLQVGFIDFVVSPLWTAIGTILPELSPLVANMGRNRATWKAIQEGTTTVGEAIEKDRLETEAAAAASSSTTA